MVRGKGEGSIALDRKTGLWVGRIELPSHDFDDAGKPIRRRKVVRRKDKAELLREMKTLTAALSDRGDMPTSSQPLTKWATHWITSIAPKVVRPTTMSSYSAIVYRHIIPTLGAVRLEKVTTGDVRRLLSSMEEKGMAPNYMRNTFAVLSSMLRTAEREGLLNRNPCDLMDAPRKGKVQLEVLDQDEVVRLLRLFEQSDEALIWATFMLTGARRGEILGLEWDRIANDEIDLSWQLQRIIWSHGCGQVARGQRGQCGFTRGAACPDRRIIAPNDHEYRHIEGALYFTRPKSRAGWRVIPLVEPLRSWLEEWRATAPINAHGLVFTNKRGGPIDPESASDAWPRVRAGVGIARPVRLHDLRHSAIDAMYRAGVEESAIMRIFGHSTVQVSRSYRSAGDRTREVLAMRRLSESLGYRALEGGAPSST